MTDLRSLSAFEDGPVNILMVDDRPSNLLGYQTILEDLGENLLTANSARAALEILLQLDVAVLIVDVVMPDFDGFEFVEMIRAHPRFERTAVIFVSGVNGNSVDNIGEDAAVDFISVPVVPRLLRAKVRVFTELYRKTRQLERLEREFEVRVKARAAEVEAEARARDEVFATLAHEIRNPLAPIVNCVRLLGSGALEPAAAARNQKILEQQVLHLRKLVDDLFDVPRLSPVHAISDVVPLHSSSHPLATEIPFVSVDPIRMAEVLSNIIEGAAPDGGKILIGLSKDNDDVVLRIADTSSRMAPRAEQPTTQAQPIRVLTIDDNAVHADTLAQLLERSGCLARATYSGEEAMRVGEELEPDIVLLDLVMPTMDGFEAAKRLRETPWGSRAKLVAVTGWGASDRQKTADAGFDGHLVKPVDLDVVLQLVQLIEN